MLAVDEVRGVTVELVKPMTEDLHGDQLRPGDPSRLVFRLHAHVKDDDIPRADPLGAVGGRELAPGESGGVDFGFRFGFGGSRRAGLGSAPRLRGTAKPFGEESQGKIGKGEGEGGERRARTPCGLYLGTFSNRPRPAPSISSPARMKLFGRSDSSTSASEPTKEQVLGALRTVIEPDLKRDLVSLNMVKNVAVCGGTARFEIELTTPACPLKKQIEDEARAAVLAVPGMKEVHVEFSANVTSRMGIERPSIAGLKNIVAVTSGKGGVGKSTCTVNLATAIAQTGARVGLLDCDVYGPDIPTMLGLREKPEGTPDKKFVPLERYGVKSMSIGYLVDEEAPIVWRGPMLHKVIEQFLKDVAWGELDYLLVDMPPGTGDAQLSLSQLVPLTGAVIVTTPQDVALVDVKKAIAMFGQVRVPILGIVENMAGFTCAHCHEVTQIFGQGGADKLAAKYNVPVLGRVPLDPRVRVGGDTGAPIVVSDPTNPVAAGFREVAGKLCQIVSVRNANVGVGGGLPVLE